MIKDLNLSTPDISFSREGLMISSFANTEGYDIHIRHTFSGVTQAWQEYDKPIQLLIYNGHRQIILFDGRSDSSTFGAMQELWAGTRNPLVIDIPAGVVFGWQSIEAGDSLLQIPQGAALKQHPADTHLIPFRWEK